jgi:hypothetical protein
MLALGRSPEIAIGASASWPDAGRRKCGQLCEFDAPRGLCRRYSTEDSLLEAIRAITGLSDPTGRTAELDMTRRRSAFPNVAAMTLPVRANGAASSETVDDATLKGSEPHAVSQLAPTQLERLPRYVLEVARRLPNALIVVVPAELAIAAIQAAGIPNHSSCPHARIRATTPARLARRTVRDRARTIPAHRPEPR